MIRVNKPTARKMYRAGLTVKLVPCKCAENNIVANCTINFIESGKMFDRVANAFEFYNCNVKLGYYTHFYVSEQDWESFQMCESMCSG